MKGDFTRSSFKPENHYTAVLKQQGRVDLDADWNEQDAIVVHRATTEANDVIGASGAPAGNPGFQLTAANNGKDLSISKGRAYVDGVLCENEQDVTFSAQPDLPGAQLPSAAGIYFAYLDVWQRHISVLDDPDIREDALGGPDTCTRAKTVWQVKLLQAGKTGDTVDCATKVAAWDSLVAASTGTIAARAEPDPASTDPCIVPAKAGFRRLENQLYRVEIHDPSSGTLTFKWSRDNGSVATSWTGKNGNVLTVTTTRDSVLGFAAGQWVELTDDTHELNFIPGTLVQLVSVQGQNITINPATATGSVTFSDFPDNPKVRRWDSAAAIALSAGNWVDLEDGVQVNFSSGTYDTGDYWLIPARTLKSDIDWPQDGSGQPLSQSPNGIRHHYCRLAVLQFNGTAWTVQSLCLPIFPPLTGIRPGQDDNGIHVVDVRMLKPDVPILNDSDILISDVLSTSIRILCDGPISASSAQPTTCFLAVQLPWPLFDTRQDTLNIFGTFPLTLPAAVRGASTNAGGIIEWRMASAPTIQFLVSVLTRMISAQQPPRLLARLTAKGNFIWDADPTPNLYLDGEAFGIQRKDADGSSHIGLRPPSGNGKRGGDFEMWFWLTLPATLSGLTLSPSSVPAGTDAIGTVILTGAAPAGGAVVTLAGAAVDASGAVIAGVTLATVPPSVTVPAGQSSATFPITKTTLPANPTLVITSATVRVTATLGTASQQATLTITKGR